MKIVFTGGGTAGHAMVNTVLIPYLQKKECKITYVDRIKKDKFPDELKKNYPIDDYHFLYYGEIVDCYN